MSNSAAPTAPSSVSDDDASTKFFTTAAPPGATSVNWVTAGKVTPIRNQYQCGSCWAFAVTAAIESMYLIKVPGASVSNLALSPQQLVSCCTAANGCNSNGCKGGWADEVSSLVIGLLTCHHNVEPPPPGVPTALMRASRLYDMLQRAFMPHC